MLPRVLLVEDDDYMASAVCKSLKKEHVDVTRVANAAEARELLAIPFQLVMLDLGLPDASGIDLCREFRQSGSGATSILILTSRDSELDKVLGLESGADDYVTKPFSMPELMARVRSIFRRMKMLEPAVSEDLEVAGIRVNEATREVLVKGRSLTLTAKEFDLLNHFVRHPGVVYTRSDLLNSVWGHRRRRDEHAVSCHINRLRAKLESDPSHPQLIQTVWGVGYRMNPLPAQ